MSTPRSLFGPLLLIAVGAVWLLTRSGYLPSSNLWALTHVWPYILIAAGAGLILRAYWRQANLLMDVIIVGGVTAAIFFAPALGWDNPSVNTFMFDDNGFIGPYTPGSGNVVTQTRELDDFQKIEVDYPAQVIVVQGDETSVKIEAEDNFIDGLQTRVQNETLRIFYRVEDGDRVRPTKVVKVTVTVKELTDVNFGGAGDLTLEGIQSDELNLDVSGAGNLKLNDIDAKELSIDMSGAGNISASGEADALKMVISGFGNFNGKDLQVMTADVNLSGAGSATLWVEDRLEAGISGAGSINYYGSPEVTRRVSGVGSVGKSGDK